MVTHSNIGIMEKKMETRQSEIKAGTRILPLFAALPFVVTICGFAFLGRIPR